MIDARLLGDSAFLGLAEVTEDQRHALRRAFGTLDALAAATPAEIVRASENFEFECIDVALAERIAATLSAGPAA